MEPTQNQNSGVQDLSIDEQKRLSQPLVKKDGISPEDQSFLNMIVAKIESGEIKLLVPSTLINQTVYQSLSAENQGKVDMNAMNLLSDLRSIYSLWKATSTATFQIENMVHAVRLRKENLENISGDIFII